MERYEINKYLEKFAKSISDLYDALDIKNKEVEVKKLDEEISDINFWNDTNKANQTIKKANLLKEDLEIYNNVKEKYDEILLLDEYSKEDNDALIMLEDEIKQFINLIDKAEEVALLSDEYDDSDCILELHPGAGGTESMDWAQILYRMYSRFCQKEGYKFTILDYQAGEEAGIKSVTVEIKGKYAYGMLKSERGVHRLVRISPFDSGARRHTSFCSCDVSPLIEDTTKVEIKPEDLRVDVYHSSGAGGQSVNTTDSAVRMTHIPTGIVVTCQNERSQIKNREVAYKILVSKLVEIEILKKQEQLNKIKGEQMGINFGSQIRSYVFTPYTLVKDHRTNYELNNVNDVIDGNLTPFMMAYLKYEKGQKNE